MRIWFQKRRTVFRKNNWTPRALQVIATAKAAAAPGLITPRHLIVALEAGDTIGAQAFQQLGIVPSASLGKIPPVSLCPDGELLIQDFAPELRDLQRLAGNEARIRGWQYLGTDALVLVLARIGVPGVDLPYERVSEIVADLLTP